MTLHDEAPTQRTSSTSRSQGDLLSEIQVCGIDRGRVVEHGRNFEHILLVEDGSLRAGSYGITRGVHEDVFCIRFARIPCMRSGDSSKTIKDMHACLVSRNTADNMREQPYMDAPPVHF